MARSKKTENVGSVKKVADTKKKKVDHDTVKEEVVRDGDNLISTECRIPKF